MSGPMGGRAWQPWAIAGFGVALLVLSAVQWSHLEGALAAGLVEWAFPVAFSLGLVAFGWWLRTSDFEPPEMAVIVAGCGVGTIALAALGGWGYYLATTAGMPPAESTFILFSTTSFGALGGGVLGLYEARQRQHRRRTEATYRDLRQVGIDLSLAEDADEAIRLALEAAESILGRPSALVWLADAGRTELRVADMTQRTRALLPDPEEPFSHARGDAIWELYERGEHQVIEELDPGLLAVDVPLASVQIVPLGDHGVLTLGATEPAAFDETDVDLADILATNLTAALDRLERQEALATREERLRTVVENAPLVLFVLDDERTVTLSEGQGLERIGFEPGEMVGQTVEELFGDNQSVMDAIELAYAGDEHRTTISVGDRVFETTYLPVTGTGGEFSGVVGVAVDVTERERRERSIRLLHRATRDMIGAPDETAIAELAVGAAEQVLGLPLTTMWLYDEGRNELRPVAWTDACADLFEEFPTYSAGDGSLTWDAFESGETRNFADVQAAGARNPETPLGSELIVPVGEHGVFNIASMAREAYDDGDVALANLLASNTAVALDRVDYERELARRNDQLEFFNSILRHDVLNGMTVIRSRGELLAQALDGDRGEYAATIVAWCDDVVDIVGRVRHVLDTLTAEQEPVLEPVDVSRILAEEVGRVRTTYPAVTFDLDVGDGTRVYADELLADVLGNLVTNAVVHNEEDLRVAVSAARRGEVVSIRVADDGTGVADDRKEAVFRRGETGHAKATGSGFGLYFVDAMVERYGGTVHVEDNERGGATFVVQLQAVA